MEQSLANTHSNWPDIIDISPNTSPSFDSYKTQPCFNFFSNGYCPCPQKCTYFHNMSDKRRYPFNAEGTLQYQPIFCPSLLVKGQCCDGEYCQYSHNSYEKDYHPFAQDQQSITKCLLPHNTLTPNFMIKQYDQMLTGNLDITTFKLMPCKLEMHHNQKHCLNYHSEKDRRRNPKIYSPEKCQYFETGSCPLGETCPFSHNNVEKLYHPEKYKTKFCNDYYQASSNCLYGGFCCFAHSESEIQIELIHNMLQDENFFMFYFKTVWCPFNFEHNKALCLYAHNWQDFRRKPHLFEYNNTLCPNWRSDTFLCVYHDGCQLEANCKYCHGWKEQQYHPMDYKTKPCPEGRKCSRAGSSACPFYHSNVDKRDANTMMYVKIAPPMNGSIKLHPYSNINDQKEIFINQNKEKSNHLKLLYPSFNDEGDTHHYKLNGKGRYKSEASYGSLVNEKYMASPPMSSEMITRPAKIPSFMSMPMEVDKFQVHKMLLSHSDKSIWDEKLFSFLMRYNATHLFEQLNGKITIEEMCSSGNKDKLFQLGLRQEDVMQLEVCIKHKRNSENLLSPAQNAYHYKNTDDSIHMVSNK